jgi:hypothetical protein
MEVSETTIRRLRPSRPGLQHAEWPVLVALAARDQGACVFSLGDPASRESNGVPCLVGSPKGYLDLESCRELWMQFLSNVE